MGKVAACYSAHQFDESSDAESNWRYGDPFVGTMSVVAATDTDSDGGNATCESGIRVGRRELFFGESKSDCDASCVRGRDQWRIGSIRTAWPIADFADFDRDTVGQSKSECPADARVGRVDNAGVRVADVDQHCCMLGDCIDRRAAFDDANVECRWRRGRQESVASRKQRVDRAAPTTIAPRVSAGANEVDTKSNRCDTADAKRV